MMAYGMIYQQNMKRFKRSINQAYRVPLCRLGYDNTSPRHVAEMLFGRRSVWVREPHELRRVST